MVIPRLSECIARPDSLDGSPNHLVDHLLAVAGGMGDPSSNQEEEKLNFLAGLLHDAGKARKSWQRFIRGEEKEAPWHSPLGSALFFFFSVTLLEKWQMADESRYRLQWISCSLAIDVASHHGALRDLTEDPPWLGNVAKDAFEEIDLDGFITLVKQYIPEFCCEKSDFDIYWSNNQKIWKIWRKNASRHIKARIDVSNSRYKEACKINVRTNTSRLISADRFDAAKIRENRFEQNAAVDTLDFFLKYCDLRAREVVRNGVPGHMVKTRRKIQEGVYYSWLSNCDRKFFSNILPTGYGKTLSALCVALDSCARGKTSRIVYVAPYLSILSQASQEIATAAGMEVMSHHHLSILQEQEISDAGYLAMESWQSPIVTTTYNQFFRAVLPYRAQQSMRLKALRGSFVIIDEPQIIDWGIWQTFLYHLNAVASELNMKVLFTTATMPPINSHLDVVPLAPAVEPRPNRYKVITLQGGHSEDIIAQMAMEKLRQKSSVAVIMNTIKDAALVYKIVKSKYKEDGSIFFLSGAMTPVHKAERIKEIRKTLANSRKAMVISTQLLEAGVDLSFECIYRATPTTPSIIQAFGRANRHAEGDMAEVYVFNFLRGGSQETRQWVYRNKISREETDRCLSRYASWKEAESEGIVMDYYRGLIARNPSAGGLEKLVRAARGEWSALSGIEPFGEDNYKVDVFVPFGEELLDEKTLHILNYFSPKGLDHLYDLYLNRNWIARLEFLERKRFMSLLGCFTVPVSLQLAPELADSSGSTMSRITKKDLYSRESGFALLEPGDFSLCCF